MPERMATSMKKDPDERKELGQASDAIYDRLQIAWFKGHRYMADQVDFPLQADEEEGAHAERAEAAGEGQTEGHLRAEGDEEAGQERRRPYQSDQQWSEQHGPGPRAEPDRFAAAADSHAALSSGGGGLRNPGVTQGVRLMPADPALQRRLQLDILTGGEGGSRRGGRVPKLNLSGVDSGGRRSS